MREYGFSLAGIMVDSVLIRETSGQWKLVFPHILCSANVWKELNDYFKEIITKPMEEKTR